MERIGQTFLAGYHAGLLENWPQVEAVDLPLRGFAGEGFAMALYLLDNLPAPGRKRYPAFLAGQGETHIYMAHVGAGWAIARLPWLRFRLDRALRSLDPMLRWLAVDGYGFHEGYFHWRRRITAQQRPAGLTGYANRAFDQGLGRSLWFVEGADPARIAHTIGQFPGHRQADLWAGAGLAAAYAGGSREADLRQLAGLAEAFRPHVAQGATFAAEARRHAGNPTPHTDLACRVFCGMTAESAALWARTARESASYYEHWRARIRDRFSGGAPG